MCLVRMGEVGFIVQSAPVVAAVLLAGCAARPQPRPGAWLVGALPPEPWIYVTTIDVDAGTVTVEGNMYPVDTLGLILTASETIFTKTIYNLAVGPCEELGFEDAEHVGSAIWSQALAWTYRCTR